MVTTPTESPRHLVFGLRSYAGSRTAFLLAAARLLKAIPQVKVERRSTIEVYAPRDAEPGYLASSLLIESPLAIVALLDVARGIERQLADPAEPDARQMIRIDLLWVDGVEIRTPDLELPSALLFTQSWAIGTFTEAAEMAITKQSELERFNRSLKEVPPPHESDQIPYLPSVPSMTRLPTIDSWVCSAYDWLDGLAAAAEALARARMAADASVLGEAEQLAVLKNLDADIAAVSADDVQFVNVRPSGGATDEQIARAWLDGVQAQLAAHPMRMGAIAVISADAGSIRGFLIGERSRVASRSANILSVDVDRDPAESRANAASRRTPNRTRVTLRFFQPSH